MPDIVADLAADPAALGRTLPPEERVCLLDLLPESRHESPACQVEDASDKEIEHRVAADENGEASEPLPGPPLKTDQPGRAALVADRLQPLVHRAVVERLPGHCAGELQQHDAPRLPVTLLGLAGLTPCMNSANRAASWISTSNTT